ncbi:ras guanine nucleotide exchange factor domain-containing protein [Schizophyllum commune]
MHPRQWGVRRRSSTDSAEKHNTGDLRPDSIMRTSSSSSSSDRRSSHSSSDYYSADHHSVDSRTSSDSQLCHPAPIAHALDSPVPIVHRNSAGLIQAGTLHGIVGELIAQANATHNLLPHNTTCLRRSSASIPTSPPRNASCSASRNTSSMQIPYLPQAAPTCSPSYVFRLIQRWVENVQVAPAMAIVDRMAALARRALASPSPAALLDRVNAAAHAVEQRRVTLASRVRDGASSPHNGSGDNVARIPSVSSGQGVAPSVKPLRASEVTPTELATALTLLEGERYRGIKPADYIRYLKHRPASTASSSNPSLGDAKKLRGVQAMSALNNDIIHWVKFSVLDPEDVEARASAMLFLINTAEECRRLRNFSSTTAIANALQSSPIERLRYTRQRIPATAQRTLDELVSLLDPSSNHRAYRAALRQSHDRPTLPWLAVHLRDLNASLERYPQAISVTPDGEALLNYERIARAAACMGELLPDPSTLADRRPLHESPHAPAIAYLRRELRHSARSRSNEELLERAQALAESEEQAHRARARELEGLGFRVK